MDGLTGLAVDAIPLGLPVTVNENPANEIEIENLLSEFSVEDYKSAFFLLMDFVGVQKFLLLTKKDKAYLKNAFLDLYNKFLNEKLLIELLGTLKMYKQLRMLGTCSHIYENQEKKFNGINGLWKVLYSLCEELTDDHLGNLKQQVCPDSRDQILSSEEWFCWALQNKLFSKTDLFNLKDMFKNYPKCLDIIKNYTGYDVRTPTAEYDCGIAVIFNYDEFNENSGLNKRESSYKDVYSLVHLWDAFGFQVHVHSNLTSSQTFEKIKGYASEDHSNYDVFVCCILSHGMSNIVYSSDGKKMEILDLQAPVVNDCLSLNKKPKLFFIQACQGTNLYLGAGKLFDIGPVITPVKDSYNSSKCDSYNSSNITCDVLTVNSSIDGFVSFRDNGGSWLIQSLCKQMMQKGDNSSIEEVMTDVSEEVRNKYSDSEPSGDYPVQIVPRQSTLLKKLILKKRTR